MFPVQLNPDHYSFVVVGGGYIANHKVQNLLRFGVKPLIISPVFHPNLITLSNQNRVILQQKHAEWSDIVSHSFLIIVTNDEAVNDELAIQALKAGKLVVHAANPSLSNVQLPAVLRRGKLHISVATEGASPTLAKQIRDELAVQYDERYENYLDFLAEIRHFVKTYVAERSKRTYWLKEAASPAYLEHTEARALLWARLYRHTEDN